VIDLQRYRFEGREEIQVSINETTTTVTSHAIELWVTNVKITLPNGTSQACHELRTIDEDQTITFVFKEPLIAGTMATLYLSFHGILNDQLRGFYRAEYDVHGEKRMMAASQVRRIIYDL
jgi:puromycin-sensitive aminopeptidase